jgi:hypothetical protein
VAVRGNEVRLEYWPFTETESPATAPTDEQKHDMRAIAEEETASPALPTMG